MINRSNRLMVLGVATALVAAAAFVGLRKRGPAQPRVVGSFRGGELTANDLEEGMRRLAPALRREFDSPRGRREVAQSLIDKRLLAQEGKRRGIDRQPAIRQQVDEIEERLVVQALIAEEERGLPPQAEGELQRAYETHKAELVQPERVRLGRVLVSVGVPATAEAKARARRKAEQIERRLRAGEPLAKVAAAGDGSEAKAGGAMGWIVRGEGEPAVEAAAFALKTQGEISLPTLMPQGWAVLVLLERTASRIPTFAEARGEVAGREDAARRRRSFDQLIARLRRSAEIELRMEATR